MGTARSGTVAVQGPAAACRPCERGRRESALYRRGQAWRHISEAIPAFPATERRFHRSKCRVCPSIRAVQGGNASGVLRPRDVGGGAAQVRGELRRAGKPGQRGSARRSASSTSPRFSTTCVLSVSMDSGTPPSFMSYRLLRSLILPCKPVPMCPGGLLQGGPKSF